MLYEIISPDAFPRPFMDDYATLSAIYAVVRNAYARRVQVDRAFLRKTYALVQEHVGVLFPGTPVEDARIGADTIALFKAEGGDSTRIINLVKRIEAAAEDQSGDPFLIAFSERARAVLENFEERQLSTQEALAELQKMEREDEERKRTQESRGFDSVTFFIFRKLDGAGFADSGALSRNISAAFSSHPNWRTSDREMRELRQLITLALFAAEENLDKVTAIVDDLFTTLAKGRAP